MTECELLELAKQCLDKAKTFSLDKDLVLFYLRACQGFLVKAKKFNY